MFLTAGYRKDNKIEHKPVSASFALHSIAHSEQTIDRASIGSPPRSEGAGSQEALHSPTTGQLKTANVRRRQCDMLSCSDAQLFIIGAYPPMVFRYLSRHSCSKWLPIGWTNFDQSTHPLPFIKAASANVIKV